MKGTKRKREKNSLEKNVRKLFREKGEKALETTKNLVQEEAEKIESKEAREALQYFINEYWHDVVTPALIALSCEAVGGNPDDTVPLAVPVILISGSVDIHDDIIDKSTAKYNRQTVLGKYGQDVALLVGDAFLFKGLMLLQDAAKHFPHDKFAQVTGILKNTFFELGDAEVSETKFRGNLDVTPEEYLHVMRKKAADVEGLFHVGALIGGGSSQEIEALRQFGRNFGLLAILRDDWVDTLDREELKHRARFEHLPLPLLYALRDPRVRAKAERVLLKDRRAAEKDVQELLEIAEKFGGFRHTRRIIKGIVADGEKNLACLKRNRESLELLLKFSGKL